MAKTNTSCVFHLSSETKPEEEIKTKNIVTCSVFARSFKGKSFPGAVPSGWSKTNKVSFNVFSKDWSLAAKGPK